MRKRRGAIHSDDEEEFIKVYPSLFSCLFSQKTN